MPDSLEIISSAYWEDYLKSWDKTIDIALNHLQGKGQFTSEDFEYYVIASSLFSSKIEGNSLDFNSFYGNRQKKSFPKKKEVEEIENLAEAYKYASENALHEANFLYTHFLLSATLLPEKERGRYRKEQVGIRDSVTGRPVYLAVEPEFVAGIMAQFFSDINKIQSLQLDNAEVFYYASMIHLWIAMIHPFDDGNGRAARLAEKWFLSAKLGMPAWAIASEKYYWDHRPEYYQNIALGFNYYALHWERCMPFLEMLPKALRP